MPGGRAEGGRSFGESGEPSASRERSEVLCGEAGFWQHWWREIDQAKAQGSVPLTMDIVVADTGAFESRHWIAGFDPEIRDYVLGERLLTGRAIVPPGAIGSPAEPLLELGIDAGFEVRVLSTDARFVVYGGTVAIVSATASSACADRCDCWGGSERGLERSECRDHWDPPGRSDRSDAAEHVGGGDPVDVHRAVREPETLAQLTSYFTLLWNHAVPLQHLTSDTERVLALLAQGMSDAEIAEELCISLRTVSRRIADAMQAHHASSRFELGVKIARARCAS